MDQIETPKNKALPLFILLFLASLTLSAFLFFKYAKNAATIQQQSEELKLSYEILELDQDSISNKLAIVEQQLQDRINEILAQEDLKEELRQQLGVKSRALGAARSKISRLINGEEGMTSSSGGPRNLLEATKQIKYLRDSVTSYITKAQRSQQNYVAAKNAAAKSEALALVLLKAKDSVNKENKLLNDKLGAASLLRVIEFSATPIRDRRGTAESTDKASKVERIKFNFLVQESTLIKKEDKKLVIRIISPNGSILTQNTRELTASKDLFSLEESITYDGTEKGVTLYYDQEAAYTDGAYTAELWHAGIIIDRNRFSLR
jgi:cell division protein ZapB